MSTQVNLKEVGDSGSSSGSNSIITKMNLTQMFNKKGQVPKKTGMN